MHFLLMTVSRYPVTLAPMSGWEALTGAPFRWRRSCRAPPASVNRAVRVPGPTSRLADSVPWSPGLPPPGDEAEAVAPGAGDVGAVPQDDGLQVRTLPPEVVDGPRRGGSGKRPYYGRPVRGPYDAHRRGTVAMGAGARSSVGREAGGPVLQGGGAVTGYPGHPVTGGSGHGLPFGCR